MQPDRDTQRQRILDAALAEFADNGQAASVHVIARRAGVTAAMINYYFGGKAALYDAAIEAAQQALSAHLARALDAPSRAPLASRVAEAYFDFLADNRSLQRVFLREVTDRGDRARDFARRFVAPLRPLLASHFGHSDEVAQLAISLFGAVAGYFVYEPLLHELLGEDPLSADSLARRRRHVSALAARMAKMQPSSPRPSP